MQSPTKRAKMNDPTTGVTAAVIAIGVLLSVAVASVAPAFTSGVITGGIAAATPVALIGGDTNIQSAVSKNYSAGENPYVISLILL